VAGRGAADALTSLTTQCPVAILSGRDLAAVRQRIGLPGIWYAGSQGFELTGPDGTHHGNAEAAASIPVLEEAAAELADQLGHISGVVVEHKRFGVAVHYRNAARDRVGEVSAAVRSAGRRTALRVTTGREVIELRPNVDWDKGKTLRWVLDYIRHDEHPGPLLPIYLGDDITDEDAFDAVQDDGIPIVVRHTDDGDRATAAKYALDNPERVRDFAELLASAGSLITGSRVCSTLAASLPSSPRTSVSSTMTRFPMCSGRQCALTVPRGSRNLMVRLLPGPYRPASSTDARIWSWILWLRFLPPPQEVQERAYPTAESARTMGDSAVQHVVACAKSRCPIQTSTTSSGRNVSAVMPESRKAGPARGSIRSRRRRS
jgi:trehalose 6-phosphate phosphatase